MERKNTFTLCPMLFSFLNEAVSDKTSIPQLRLLMDEDGCFDHLIITGPGSSGKSTLEQFIKSLLALNLAGIKSNVYVQSVIRDTPAPNLPAPFLNIHLKREIPSEVKDPYFLSKLKWETIDFAKWVLAL